MNIVGISFMVLIAAAWLLNLIIDIKTGDIHHDWRTNISRSLYRCMRDEEIKSACDKLDKMEHLDTSKFTKKQHKELQKHLIKAKYKRRYNV